MTDPGRSHAPGHFERIYAANADPWDYLGSAYESAKRDATIEALRDRRYASGLEVGCSIGVLTRRMADRCDRLLAIDFIDDALVGARAACVDRQHVSFQNMRVPAEWPDGAFELIVLSEVLCFLSASDNLALVGRCKDALAPSGEILLVNWLGDAPGDPCSGNEAASCFIAAAGSWLRVGLHRKTDRYRIDRLERRVR